MNATKKPDRTDKPEKTSRAVRKSEAPPEPEASVRPELKKKRILLVEDHPIVRVGLSKLISTEPDLEICGEAGSPAEAFTHLDREVPDLMLTDMNMPGRSGLEFVRDVLAVHPELPVLVLSMHDEGFHAERALRAGARGYIMKGAGGEKLIIAIRQVLSGENYVSDTVKKTILSKISGRQKSGPDSPVETLSDREFQVLRLTGQGKTVREIADELHLSPKTVDVHRANIKKKLNLRDSMALIRYAVRFVEIEQDPAAAGGELAG
jgi:DNA-binding NarL/FixJ family response regulator